MSKKVTLTIRFDTSVERFKDLAHASIEAGFKGDITPLFKNIAENISTHEIIEICTRK